MSESVNVGNLVLTPLVDTTGIQGQVARMVAQATANAAAITVKLNVQGGAQAATDLTRLTSAVEDLAVQLTGLTSKQRVVVQQTERVDGATVAAARGLGNLSAQLQRGAVDQGTFAQQSGILARSLAETANAEGIFSRETAVSERALKQLNAVNVRQMSQSVQRELGVATQAVREANNVRLKWQTNRADDTQTLDTLRQMQRGYGATVAAIEKQITALREKGVLDEADSRRVSQLIVQQEKYGQALRNLGSIEASINGTVQKGSIADSMSRGYQEAAGKVRLLIDQEKAHLITKAELRTALTAETRSIETNLAAIQAQASALRGKATLDTEEVAKLRQLERAEGRYTAALRQSILAQEQAATVSRRSTLLRSAGGRGANDAAMALSFISPEAGMLGMLAQSGPTVAAVGAVGLAVGGVVKMTKDGQGEVKRLQTAFNILRVNGGNDLGQMNDQLDAMVHSGNRVTEEFSKADLATALASLARGGEKGSEGMIILATSTKLAVAEHVNLDDATKRLYNNLQHFNLGAKDSVMFADKLAQAAHLSMASMDDLSKGLNVAGAVMKDSGVNLDKTLGYLVALAKKGMDPATIGATGLRNVMLALTKPSKEASAAIFSLGVDLQTTDGHARKAGDVLEDLRRVANSTAPVYDKLSGKLLTHEDIMQRVATVFRTRGLTAFLGLTGAADEASEHVAHSTGMLDKFSQGMTDGLAPAQRRLEAATKDLSRTFAETFTPALAGSVEIANETIRWMGTMGTKANEAKPYLVGLAGVITAVGVASLTSSTLVKELILAQGIGGIANVATVAATALQLKLLPAIEGTTAATRSFMLLNPVVLFAVAAGALTLYVNGILANLNRIQDAINGMEADNEKQLQKLYSKGRLGELMTMKLQLVQADTTGLTPEQLQHRRDDIAKLDAQIQALQASQKAIKAGPAFNTASADAVVQQAFRNTGNHLADSVVQNCLKWVRLTLDAASPKASAAIDALLQGGVAKGVTPSADSARENARRQGLLQTYRGVDDLHPGDVVFYDKNHVGIYIGNGMVRGNNAWGVQHGRGVVSNEKIDSLGRVAGYVRSQDLTGINVATPTTVPQVKPGTQDPYAVAMARAKELKAVLDAAAPGTEAWARAKAAIDNFAKSSSYAKVAVESLNAEHSKVSKLGAAYDNLKAQLNVAESLRKNGGAVADYVSSLQQIHDSAQSAAAAELAANGAGSKKYQALLALAGSTQSKMDAIRSKAEREQAAADKKAEKAANTAAASQLAADQQLADGKNELAKASAQVVLDQYDLQVKAAGSNGQAVLAVERAWRDRRLAALNTQAAAEAASQVTSLERERNQKMGAEGVTKAQREALWAQYAQRIAGIDTALKLKQQSNAQEVSQSVKKAAEDAAGAVSDLKKSYQDAADGFSSKLLSGQEISDKEVQDYLGSLSELWKKAGTDGLKGNSEIQRLHDLAKQLADPALLKGLRDASAAYDSFWATQGSRYGDGQAATDSAMRRSYGVGEDGLNAALTGSGANVKLLGDAQSALADLDNFNREAADRIRRVYADELSQFQSFHDSVNAGILETTTAAYAQIRQSMADEQAAADDAGTTVESLTTMLQGVLANGLNPETSGYVPYLDELITKGGQAGEAAQQVKDNLQQLINLAIAPSLQGILDDPTTAQDGAGDNSVGAPDPSVVSALRGQLDSQRSAGIKAMTADELAAAAAADQLSGDGKDLTLVLGEIDSRATAAAAALKALPAAQAQIALNGLERRKAAGTIGAADYIDQSETEKVRLENAKFSALERATEQDRIEHEDRLSQIRADGIAARRALGDQELADAVTLAQRRLALAERDHGSTGEARAGVVSAMTAQIAQARAELNAMDPLADGYAAKLQTIWGLEDQLRDVKLSATLTLFGFDTGLNAFSMFESAGKTFGSSMSSHFQKVAEGSESMSTAVGASLAEMTVNIVDQLSQQVIATEAAALATDLLSGNWVKAGVDLAIIGAVAAGDGVFKGLVGGGGAPTIADPSGSTSGGSTASSAASSAPAINYNLTVENTFNIAESLDSPGTRQKLTAMQEQSALQVMGRIGLIKLPAAQPPAAG